MLQKLSNIDYYASGVLTKEKHSRLVSNISNVADDANIPTTMIAKPASEFCGEEELNWIRAYKHLEDSEDAGLCYVGNGGDIGVRMFAVAGAFLRNYIRARVFTLQDVIESYKGSKPLEASVLLIPNFFLRTTSGGKIPEWQLGLVLGMLYQRYSYGNKTVIYVEDLEQLGGAYGNPMKEHIERHFKIIKGGKL